MVEKKFIGWGSLLLFILSTANLLLLVVLLIFSRPLDGYFSFNPQVMVAVSGILALVASVLGFYAFKNLSGKVGAIGGLVLLILTVGFLSLTVITSVQKYNSRQIQPVEFAAIRSYSTLPSIGLNNLLR